MACADGVLRTGFRLFSALLLIQVAVGAFHPK